MSSVAVVDYGIGNVFSVCNALRKIGAEPLLTRDPGALLAADRVILPGVGAFSSAMSNLRRYALDTVIADFIATGRPFLGVCIGMQLLMERSTEFGLHDGLGLIRGTVDRIPAVADDGHPLRVPHIAWSEVHATDALQGGWQAATFDGARHYYFVHSYMARPDDPSHLLAVARYGGHQITAAVRKENVTGVQFHPERSGPEGLRLLSNFVNASGG